MRRRRTNRLMPVFVFVLVCLIVFILYRFVFVVRTVRVDGVSQEYTQTIVRAANVDFGGSLLFVDRESMTDGISRTGSFCADSIDIEFPNRLVITVHERKPVAMILYMESILLLDRDGCVVSAGTGVPEESPIYVSDLSPSGYKVGSILQTDSEVLRNYCAVIGAIVDQSAQEYISELKVADSRNIRIITRSKTEVDLGTWENMAAKISWMKSAVADLESRGERYGTLDVSSGKSADYMPASEEDS